MMAFARSIRGLAPVSLKTAVGRSLSILEQLTGVTPGSGGRSVLLVNRYRDALRACLGVLDLRPYRTDEEVRMPTKRERTRSGEQTGALVTDVGKVKMRLHDYCTVILDHIAAGRGRPDIEIELREVINKACEGSR